MILIRRRLHFCSQSSVRLHLKFGPRAVVPTDRRGLQALKRGDHVTRLQPRRPVVYTVRVRTVSTRSCFDEVSGSYQVTLTSADS